MAYTWDRAAVLRQIDNNAKDICAPAIPTCARPDAFNRALPPAAVATPAAPADHPLGTARSGMRHYARGSPQALRYAAAARWPLVPDDAGDTDFGGERARPAHIAADVAAIVDVLVVATRLPATAARKLTLSCSRGSLT